jgi:hypothetical protein
MDSISYACCFCGESIDTDSKVSRGLDPCAVVVVANWRGPESQQLSQQFFCHLQCFKGKMNDETFMDIEGMEPGDQA